MARKRVKARRSRRGYRQVRLYRRVRRRAKRTANSAAMKAIKKPEVKRVIAESSYALFNPFVSSAGDIMNVLPALYQGVASNQRVGTKIVVKNITIKGVITAVFPQNNVRFAKLGIRHMLLRKRNRNNYNDIVTGDLSTLLEREAGPTAYNGLILDQLANINKRQWVAGKDRKYTINQPYILSAAGVVEAPNKTVTVPFKWRIAKGAVLTYENGNAYVPQNWPWFMSLGFTYWDNSVPSSLDIPIALQYQTTMDYYDV